MAAAVRAHPAIDGPHDLPLVGAIQTLDRQALGARVGATGFDWGDFGVGAGAVLALVLALGILRKGVRTVRSRRSEGLTA
jgi:hypothetical protein